MADRLFGLETEYAFTALNGRGGRIDREESLDLLMELARRDLPHLPDARSNGIFLQNGGRFYLDSGHHPEISTPECANPWDLVRYVRAGDHVLAHLASELEKRDRNVAQALFFKCNVDYFRVGATWGCHESYLHSIDPALLPRQIVPHLASRVIYTGAGGFNSRSPGIEFALSPRVPHLTTDISNESTHNRGIFHTKNESLSSAGYHRLHILCGESLESQLAAWLKVGTTALIVAMIEAGLNPGENVRLNQPLEAMQLFAKDTECKVSVEIRNGKRLTAIAIQRHYLACAETHVNDSFMPTWAGDVCHEWRRVLDLLERDPASLDTGLDWRIKLALFKNRVVRHSMTWESLAQWNGVLGGLYGLLGETANPGTDSDAQPVADNNRRVADQLKKLAPAIKARGLSIAELARFLALRQELFEIDTRFAQLGEKGIFSGLDRAGVLSHYVAGVGDIETAIVTPPPKGRARLRGESIRRLVSTAGQYACDWSGVWDHQQKRMLDLSDPFETVERWKPWETESGNRTAHEELSSRTCTAGCGNIGVDEALHRTIDDRAKPVPVVSKEIQPVHIARAIQYRSLNWIS